MKNIVTTILFICIVQLTACQTVQAQQVKKQTESITNKKVDIACGQCQFKMHGKGCTLAIKVNNIPYFVTGASIDSFGNAHASNGFCNAISKAIVSGTIQDSVFIAKHIKPIKN